MKTTIRILSLALIALEVLGLPAAQEYKFTDEQKFNAGRNLSVGYVCQSSPK